MSVDIEMCGMLVNGLSVPLRFNLGLCTAGVWPLVKFVGGRSLSSTDL